MADGQVKRYGGGMGVGERMGRMKKWNSRVLTGNQKGEIVWGLAVRLT